MDITRPSESNIQHLGTCQNHLQSVFFNSKDEIWTSPRPPTSQSESRTTCLLLILTSCSHCEFFSLRATSSAVSPL